MSIKTLKVSGSDALTTLEALRSDYRKTGEYPFLIGDEDELEMFEENSEDRDGDFEAILQDMQKVNLDSWIKRRRSEIEEYGVSADQLLGDWPGEADEKGSISLHRDVLSRKIHKQVYLGMVEIEQPWQLPAAISYGGWNECPMPEVQCAFHQKWFMQFGAEIVGASSDIIECVVKNPPRDIDAAIELAWEQYWYCGDIVDQGCESISNLAATLINSNYWYFWWD